MNFNAGIITFGPLIWEHTHLIIKWRLMSLMGYYETTSPLQLAYEGIQVQNAISLPIRYGSLSEGWRQKFSYNLIN